MTKALRFDLRSDTVTRPSQAMRQAMLAAPVGDDVFGEDVTVNALEQKLARQFGFDSGLFCPSGTMCNQIALRVHTRPLDEIICHELSHIYLYENGGFAAHAGCSIRFAQGEHGILEVDSVEKAIQPQADWLPDSRLVVAENTCNKGGGSVYPLERLKALSALCKARDLAFHLDGARLFNAIAASTYQAEDLHGLFDSVSICLSKGLGCPVGSVLLGSKQFITRARKVRKAMGGGMRQVGMLAAAGLYALAHNVDRLKKDHILAAKLAEICSADTRIEYAIPPETNIYLAYCHSAAGRDAFVSDLAREGVGAVPFGEKAVRMVTHLDLIDDEALLKAVKAAIR